MTVPPDSELLEWLRSHWLNSAPDTGRGWATTAAIWSWHRFQSGEPPGPVLGEEARGEIAMFHASLQALHERRLLGFVPGSMPGVNDSWCSVLLAPVAFDEQPIAPGVTRVTYSAARIDGSTLHGAYTVNREPGQLDSQDR